MQKHPTRSGIWLNRSRQRTKSFGELEDKYIPSKECIEKKLAELESGEFRAEPLSEVVGRDEIDPASLIPAWDSKGRIAVKKASSTVAMPTGPEQLRHRLTVMYNALAMLKLRRTNRVEISDVASDVFDKCNDYLLGDSDYVYGLRSGDLKPRRIDTSLDLGPQLRPRYLEDGLQAREPGGLQARRGAQESLEGYDALYSKRPLEP